MFLSSPLATPSCLTPSVQHLSPGFDAMLCKSALSLLAEWSSPSDFVITDILRAHRSHLSLIMVLGNPIYIIKRLSAIVFRPPHPAGLSICRFASPDVRCRHRTKCERRSVAKNLVDVAPRCLSMQARPIGRAAFILSLHVLWTCQRRRKPRAA